MSRVPAWAFTCFGTAPPVFDLQETAYLVYQLEQTQTDRVHQQGYVRFKGRKRMAEVKRLLGLPDAHLEPAKGTECQNRTYCTKEASRLDGPFEFGTYDPLFKVGRGSRSDLYAPCQMISQGHSMREVASEHPEVFVKYHKGFEALALVTRLPPPLERPVRVIVLWGPTNVGKTHRVRHAFPGLYSVDTPNHPWDSYSDESVIFFDEFRPEDYTIHFMNRVCDKWPFELAARYHNRRASWKTVCICANSPPTQWYLESRCWPIWDAFQRRLTQVVEVKTRLQEINLGDPCLLYRDYSPVSLVNPAPSRNPEYDSDDARPIVTYGVSPPYPFSPN